LLQQREPGQRPGRLQHLLGVHRPEGRKEGGFEGGGGGVVVERADGRRRREPQFDLQGQDLAEQPLDRRPLLRCLRLLQLGAAVPAPRRVVEGLDERLGLGVLGQPLGDPEALGADGVDEPAAVGELR
jgi:hypothetical protein